jgi:hypothetical protein
MSDPYRQPAEMPEEEEEPMSENVRIWKMVLTAFTCLVTVITVACTYSSIDTNRSNLRKVEIESSETSRAVSQARYLEAKAKSDQAMFEQMARAGK